MQLELQGTMLAQPSNFNTKRIPRSMLNPTRRLSRTLKDIVIFAASINLVLGALVFFAAESGLAPWPEKMPDLLALLWRMVFAVVGVMGLMTELWSIPRVMTRYPNPSFLKYGRWCMVLLYIALIFVAVVPNLGALIKPLKPIQLEGMLVSLILFIGVNVAWEFMSQPKDEYALPGAKSTNVPDMPITG